MDVFLCRRRAITSSRWWPIAAMRRSQQDRELDQRITFRRQRVESRILHNGAEVLVAGLCCAVLRQRCLRVESASICLESHHQVVSSERSRMIALLRRQHVESRILTSREYEVTKSLQVSAVSSTGEHNEHVFLYRSKAFTSSRK